MRRTLTFVCTVDTRPPRERRFSVRQWRESKPICADTYRGGGGGGVIISGMAAVFKHKWDGAEGYLPVGRQYRAVFSQRKRRETRTDMRENIWGGGLVIVHGRSV